MTQGLSLINPVSINAKNSINKSQGILTTAGGELASGIKEIRDVVSLITGKSLQDSSRALGTVNAGLEYYQSLLEQAKSGLEQLSNGISNLENTVNIAASQSGAALTLLESGFQTQKSLLDKTTVTTRFNTAELLTGSLGGSGTVLNAFNRQAAQLTATTVVPGGATGFGATALGTQEGKTIQTLVATTAGDTVTIDGVIFTFVAGAPANEHQVTVGGTAVTNAQNLASAILNASDAVLKSYTVDLSATDTVRLRRVSNSASTIAVGTSTPGSIVLLDVAGGVGAIDLTNVTNNASLIGTALAPNFTVLATAFGGVGGANVAVLLAPGGSNAVIDTVSQVGTFGNAADQAYAFSCTIGEYTYQGGVATGGGGGGSTANAVLRMKSQNGGGYFDVNLGAANTGAGLALSANLGDVQTAAGTMITTLNSLFSVSTFSQLRYLSIDTSAGAILSGGSTIATTTGVTAFLETTDFSDLNFTNFTIVPGAAANQATFTAVIGTKTYTLANQSVTGLVKGSQIVLTATDGSGDKFGLNLGAGGLTSMTTAAQMTAVQDAFKTMVGVGSGLTIRIGEALTDTMSVSIGNMHNNQIFVDNNGTVNTTFGITTPADQTLSSQILSNASARVKAQLAVVIDAIRNIKDIKDGLSNSIALQTDAASKYVATDYVESSDNFKQALLAIQAAIAAITQGYKVPQAALQIVQAG